MFGIWSFLRQFMYTKFIVVTDDDVNVRDWKEVIWALTTRVDPARDTLIGRTRRSTIWILQPGGRARLQDGHRCHEQMAGRNRPPVGYADRDGRGRAAASTRCGMNWVWKKNSRGLPGYVILAQLFS